MKVSFPNSRFAAADLPDGANLSEWLTVENSPILFGCRTGICGTCLCRMTASEPASVEPPEAQERELLEILCEDAAGKRLACQVHSKSDLQLEYVGLR